MDWGDYSYLWVKYGILKLGTDVTWVEAAPAGGDSVTPTPAGPVSPAPASDALSEAVRSRLRNWQGYGWQSYPSWQSSPWQSSPSLWYQPSYPYVPSY